MGDALRAVAIAALAASPASAVELVVGVVVAGLRVDSADQEIAGGATFGGADPLRNGFRKGTLHS